MQKTDKPGIYRMQPPETPAQFKGSTPRASWVTVYRLREMRAEDIDALGLRRYLRDEGEDRTT